MFISGIFVWREIMKKTEEDLIKNFYSNYDEEGRLTKKSHKPEYLITMKYIHKYLRPGMKILEIGAGTGKYSLALANEGYCVDAVELVSHNIKIMKKKIKQYHKINIYEGNAVDLDFLQNDTYDIVLLLGPMYHLFNDEDKHSAISEAIRVAKKGGIIYSAYCNNDTCMYKMFSKHKMMEYVENGYVDETFHARSIPSMFFELYRKSDIDSLMKDYDVTRLHFVGVDMLSYVFDSKFDRFKKKEFELYMDFIETICEREDLVGFSIHMLDIFRKEI